MTLLLLAALLQAAPVEAQAAFAAGDYARAAALALAAAVPPDEGASLYLAGLARFRAGHPAEALELLDRAGVAADPPERAGWNFNRGACLEALGRHAEAEAAFAAAAEAPGPLAPLALLNAGWAALDGGAAARARGYARRSAEAVGAAAPLSLVSSLDELAEAVAEREDASAREAYDAALSRFDAGDFAGAWEAFLALAHAGDAQGRAWLMAGASAFRLGLGAEALEAVNASLQLPLSDEEREVAHGYRDKLAGGLRALPVGWQGNVSAGLGADTNVQQAGAVQRDAFVPTASRQASLMVDASLLLAHRFAPLGNWVLDAAWNSSQRAYLGTPGLRRLGRQGISPETMASSAEDYSLQWHRLLLQGEQGAEALRLGASVSGELMFTGLSAFRGMQAVSGGSAWLAWRPAPGVATTLSLSAGGRWGLSAEFDYLSGARLEAQLSQQLQRGGLSGSAWARWRDERIGTLDEATSSFPAALCAGGCSSGRYVIPFGWAGPAAGVELRARLSESLGLRLEADVERRFYAADGYLEVTGADGASLRVGERRREDLRLGASAAVTWRPSARWDLALRYDGLWNVSNVDSRLESPAGACAAGVASCHAWDATDANYDKHVLLLQGTWTF